MLRPRSGREGPRREVGRIQSFGSATNHNHMLKFFLLLGQAQEGPDIQRWFTKSLTERALEGLLLNDDFLICKRRLELLVNLLIVLCLVLVVFFLIVILNLQPRLKLAPVVVRKLARGILRFRGRERGEGGVVVQNTVRSRALDFAFRGSKPAISTFAALPCTCQTDSSSSPSSPWPWP